jgi:C1A family cysteine protease
MHRSGDSGASLRETLKAVAAFGVPTEDYWPYRYATFDATPDAFLVAFAHRFQPLNYVRLDDYGLDGTKTLDQVKRALADGFPVAYGFPVYDSISMSADISLPEANGRLLGGHAVLAVGYDDNHLGKNKGSIIFRNSWGPLWGNEGYGYLPYEYVEKQWAVDFWTIFRSDWLNPKNFGKFGATDVS